MSTRDSKCHPFLTRDLKYPLHRSQMTQALLADFRAHGGALLKKPLSNATNKLDAKSSKVMEKRDKSKGEAAMSGLSSDDDDKFPVLYCNYVHQSEKSFCIDPAVVCMEFNGENDVCLGDYLDKFCFKPTKCPNASCTAAHVDHVKKFCHGKGSLHITLKQLKNQVDIAQDNVITWTWCEQCKSSPSVMLPPALQEFSFTRFLKMKFKGTKSIRWAGCDQSQLCGHLDFRDHFQYFAFKQMVACFKFDTIAVREIFFPSPKVRIEVDVDFKRSVIGPEQLEDNANPGRLIACALSAPEYLKKLSELARPCFSPVDKNAAHEAVEQIGDHQVASDNLEESPLSAGQISRQSSGQFNLPTTAANVSSSSGHIDLQFNDGLTKFSCCIFYAQEFLELRNLVLQADHSNANERKSDNDSKTSETESTIPTVEEVFIDSLANSVAWIARGGKSGSMFYKTADDRFILKEMSKTEWQSFVNLSDYYFEYLENSLVHSRPTLLAKILGIYKISHKNNKTNSTTKMYLLVMENLFFNRTIIQKFDLKGSVRNRLADMATEDDEVVLLDGNLLCMMRDKPLYVRRHCKRLLRKAIEHDTTFLSAYSVMDYSLIVGIDEEKQELCIGIIDYIRSFTWDKKVEMAIKLIPQVTSQNKKMPTIISPEMYKERFCGKLSQYFLAVPDADIS